MMSLMKVSTVCAYNNNCIVLTVDHELYNFCVGENTEDEIRDGGEADEEDGNCEQESRGVEGICTTTALAADPESN